ncbi:hypothetical protein BKA62DRAFT_803330 [Auriculariales sp. MPI-PUGE-AT-0066]|nr:hypothetical protein BKA62DRAFT_803330 [Auriculariales sp. MPI-PUGE-AT-0066]
MTVAVLLYLAEYIDRANIGNARVLGMQAELHLTSGQYNWARPDQYEEVCGIVPKLGQRVFRLFRDYSDEDRTNILHCALSAQIDKIPAPEFAENICATHAEREPNWCSPHLMLFRNAFPY